MKPAMWCGNRATGSVACLEWLWRIMDPNACGLRKRHALLLYETMAAKEDKNEIWLLRKTPRLSTWAQKGLQYGLSGTPVN